VYLILWRSNAIYAGFALEVAARYAQHLAGAGARSSRANPPRRLFANFVCPNQSVAGKLEAAIKGTACCRESKTSRPDRCGGVNSCSIEPRAYIEVAARFARIRATHTKTAP
jgi:predicted GIY-YIG superfamily endonuclease